MTPTIDINLTPCRPLCPYGWHGRKEHATDCPARPVLIPCPIWRSATFQVRLGECTHPCTARISLGEHWAQCPAHPITVSCSISGNTWEESEVDDACVVRLNARGEVQVEEYGPVSRRIASERWALVTALVLHRGDVSGHTVFTPESLPLLQQRTDVFSALADMARAEDVTCAARDAVRKARSLPPSKPLARELRESAIELQDYVERLIEQVGVLA